jgi:hypothetical protein
MEASNENIAKNGWSEYGRLVLAELQRLNQGQDDMKKDLDAKFIELNNKISEFNSVEIAVSDLQEWRKELTSKIADFNTVEKNVTDLQEWKEKVIEVWSSTQMKQSKDEIYKQKGYYQRVIGIIIAIQVIFTIVMAFKDKLF